MKSLKFQKVCHFNNSKNELVCSKNAGLPLSMKKGHTVSSYEELLKKISVLNFRNPSLSMFYRGQGKDYKNFKNKKPVRCNLYPSILRNLPIKKTERQRKIELRVSKLSQADQLLKAKLNDNYISRHRLVRWAILQHYEVCDTPLLDITPSLQSALSFAISEQSDEAFLYVLGFPQQNGAITVSIESMTQLIDLTKICPPEALRPHFQSGFLSADYPTAINQEELIEVAPRVEANFASRLVTKFHLKNTKQWIKENFTLTPKDIIYPNNEDELFLICQEIKKKI